MALPQQQSYDALAIIDAIEHASSKELAVLKDIQRSIIARDRARAPSGEDLSRSNKAILNAIMTRRGAGNDNYSPESNNHPQSTRIDSHDNRNQLQEYRSDSRRSQQQKNAPHNQKTRKNQSNSKRMGAAGSLLAAGATKITANAIKSAEKRLQSEQVAANDVFILQTNNVENHFTISPVQSVKRQKNANASAWNPPARESSKNAPAPQRNSKGQFASKDKSDQADEREEKAESKSLLKKLGALVGGKGKGGSDQLTDVAGSAAGGVLWSAGKELYDVTSGVRDKVVSLNEWNEKRKEGKASVATDPIRFPDAATNAAGSKSQRAYQANKGNNVVTLMRDQNKAVLESDRAIIEELKEISENTRGHGQSGGGIAGKLLGAISAKALGKLIGSRILSGLAAALGGKTILNLLKRLLPGAGGDDLSLPGGGRGAPGGKPGKTKTPKTNKTPKVKGGGKLGKVTMAAGAALATGAAAVKGVLSGGDSEKVQPADAKKTEQEAAKKVEGKATQEAAKKVETKAADGVTQKAGQEAAKKVETKVGEEVAEKAGKEALLKTGAKVAGKTALRAIPLVGTAIGAGMDAVEGYNDTEGQKAAFNVGDDQDVTGRQKAEYTAANIINMGGLVSGGAGLLAKGASALGFDDAAKALTFDTGDIAKSLDGGVSTVKDAFTSSSDKQTDAIRDGTKQTTEAIGKLEKGLQTSGTVTGEAAAAGAVVASEASAPAAITTNSVGNDLNIGGQNAANRSFRNNNFGNIRYVGQSDATLEAANANGEQAFAKYDSPEEGMRGLANQLSSYADGTSKAVNYQKLTNVRDIITKFAPANENDTEGYIASLSKNLGVRDNETLDLSNPDVMSKMIRQIATIEGGNPQVTDQFIKNAIGTRADGKGKWEGQFNPETLEKINQQRADKGLEALASNAQRANPERYTTTDKLIDGAKELGGKAWNTSMDKLGEFRDYSDEQLGKVFGNVEGLRTRAPDKGLTLPAGEKLPAGLARAALHPDDIGKAQRASLATSSTIVSTSAGQPQPGAVGTVDGSLVGVAQPAKSAVPQSEINKPHLVSSGGIPAQPAPDSKTKTSPADVKEADGQGWFGSTVDSLKSLGGKSMDVLGGMGKDALTSMGVDVNNPLQWAANQASGSASGLVSDLASNALAGTPLSFLSGTLSSALGNKAGELTNQAITSFSTAPQTPVTDFAGSGIAPVTARDKDSRNSDQQQISVLERIAKAVERKEPAKKEASSNPNRTAETAQPAPHKDVPLSFSDTSLEKLFN